MAGNFQRQGNGSAAILPAALLFAHLLKKKIAQHWKKIPVQRRANAVLKLSHFVMDTMINKNSYYDKR